MKINLFFICMVFAVDAARALECYQCEYHEDSPLEEMPIEDDPGYIDESCKSGRKPKKDLLHECGSEEDVCLKVHIEGERNGKKIKSTIRDCGDKKNYPGFETSKCEDKGGKELGALIGIGMPDSLKGTLCVCMGDKCNSSSMIKMTSGLFTISIGAIIFKHLNF